MIRGLSAFAFLLALAGCASVPVCPADTMPMIRSELFFGGDPTPERWQAFLDSEITPRSPDGLTIVDAYGQWRGGDGKIARERSKDLLVIASDSPDTARKIAAIRDAYKAQFRQESVLFVQTPVCGGF